MDKKINYMDVGGQKVVGITVSEKLIWLTEDGRIFAKDGTKIHNKKKFLNAKRIKGLTKEQLECFQDSIKEQEMLDSI